MLPRIGERYHPAGVFEPLISWMRLIGSMVNGVADAGVQLD
jgi:hypothetical protein